MKRAFLRWFPHVLLVLVCLLAAAALPVSRAKSRLDGGRWTVDDRGQTVSDREVVRISATPQEAHQLVNTGIDLLELREGDDLFALVTPGEQAALIAAGWDVRSDAAQTALLSRRGLAANPGYRSVAELEQFVRDTAVRYPGLTRLIDYGDSWERTITPDVGHDLLALHITSPVISGPKPVFVLIATIHAREIVTAEIAARFIGLLLEGYGTDPEITWMLQEYEVVVVPVANPDGRVIADQGFLQRKNTNRSAGGICTLPPGDLLFNHNGVDLNRNSSFRWGLIDSPLIDRCAATYPGSEPASEPETQALQSMLSGLFPAVAGPAQGQPAPEETSGLFITLHSYGELVLWPWGTNANPAPNSVALARLGSQMARLNGATPMQSYQLYPTSGTTDDWVYGSLGRAAFTFEIGPAVGSCGGFFPPFACLDGESGGNFWPRNQAALLYALQVARAPYRLPAGPDVVAAYVVTTPTTVTVTAELVAGDGQPISAAEYYLQRSPWNGGTALPLRAQDGAFDEPSERVEAQLDRALFNSTVGQELPLILVRARSAGGSWGPISVATQITDGSPATRWLPLVVRQ